MPSRRPHTKSHHGCQQCKASKIKCDESQPVCGRCHRKGLTCGLSIHQISDQTLSNQERRRHQSSSIVDAPWTPQSVTSPALSDNQGSSTTNPTRSGNTFFQSYEPTWLDLELMHHYSTVTCFFVADLPSFHRIWQFNVPKEAQSHRFLMHALLALSATQLNHDNNPKDPSYEEAAIRHQNMALGLFIPALNHITTENCNALFAASVIITILSFAPYRVKSHGGERSPIDISIDVANTIQGISAVVHSARDDIKKGPYAPLLRPDFWENTPEVIDTDTYDALDRLLQRINARIPDASSREVYASAITILQFNTKGFRSSARDDKGDIFRFLGMVEHEYVSLLRRYDPTALVILAYYGVFLRQVNGWWLEGFGQTLIKAIHLHLDEDFRPMIQWAVDKVNSSQHEAQEKS